MNCILNDSNVDLGFRKEKSNLVNIIGNLSGDYFYNNYQ